LINPDSHFPFDSLQIDYFKPEVKAILVLIFSEIHILMMECREMVSGSLPFIA